MTEKELYYTESELLTNVREFVNLMKTCESAGEIPTSFLKKVRWVAVYSQKNKRLENLKSLSKSVGLRVERTDGGTPITGKTPKTVRIRVSFTEIRNQNMLHTEVFSFEEVFPDCFKYLDL